jgi:hypothetical protein
MTDDLSSRQLTPSRLGGRNDTPKNLEFTDEDSQFTQALQIDMKSMVGDSVGNVSPSFVSVSTKLSITCLIHAYWARCQMSISPTKRDVVLAAYAHINCVRTMHDV